MAKVCLFKNIVQIQLLLGAKKQKKRKNKTKFDSEEATLVEDDVQDIFLELVFFSKSVNEGVFKICTRLSSGVRAPFLVRC